MRSWTLSLSLLLACAGVGFSSTARAQDANYTVVTNDGSTYEGQLVENVVGNHVTIKLISGEIRTFQAADVKSQGPAGSVMVTPTAPLPTMPNVVVPVVTPGVALSQLEAGTPGGPPVTYGGPDAVQIHIVKSNASEGRLFMESQSGWVPVCTMPCSTTVDPKIDYKLYNSDPFRFPAGPPLDLVADSGGRAVFRAIGGTMIGVASAGIIVGALVAANVFGSTPTAQTPAEQKANQQTQSSDLAAGLTIAGVSALVLTVGIVFCAIHPSPSLTTSTGQRLVKIATHGFSF
jgi:hypothetical protein